MGLTTLDYIVLAAYFVLMALIGLWSMFFELLHHDFQLHFLRLARTVARVPDVRLDARGLRERAVHLCAWCEQAAT